MGTRPQVRQNREHVQLLIKRLGSDLGKAVAQLADETAYGKNRLAWHRKLFVEGMKETTFRNLPPEIVREIEADSWAAMIMCVARLTDADDRRSVTIRMLPRLIREDEELQRRGTLSGTQGRRHCCIAALTVGHGLQRRPARRQGMPEGEGNPTPEERRLRTQKAEGEIPSQPHGYRDDTQGD